MTSSSESGVSGLQQHFDDSDRYPGNGESGSLPDPVAALTGEIRQTLARIGLTEVQVSGIEMKPVPKNKSGDIGFSCIPLVRKGFKNQENWNPDDMAKQLVRSLNTLPHRLVKSYEAVGTNINIHIDFKEFGTYVVREVFEKRDRYGAENIGQGAHWVVDLSSPNIAKPMSVGHLRSTNIGDALAHTLKFMGYQVTKDNHLGDWGTQFGFLIYVILRDNLFEEIESSPDPIMMLKNIYVSISAESKAEEKNDDDTIRTGARMWFSKLEKGDAKARNLWQKINEWSLAGFQGIYDQLGVTFDVMNGESFYEAGLPKAIDTLVESGIASRSEGAIVVDLRNNLNKIMGLYIEEWASIFYEISKDAEFQFTGDVVSQLQLLNQQAASYVNDENRVQTLAEIKRKLKKEEEPYRSQIETILSGIIGQLKPDVADGKQIDLNDVLAVVFERDRGNLEAIDIRRKPVLVSDPRELGGKDLGVVLIQKADGSSLYATRDLAAALYRGQELGAEGMVYVVGGEQQLYFQQLFEILRLMRHPIAEQSRHVWFGLVKGKSIDPDTGFPVIAKMSTRAGTTVLLQDLIDEAKVRAAEMITRNKNRSLNEFEQQVAQRVGIGAIKWNDLIAHPQNEIVFDWNNMLNMKGKSAPYVMYARARALKVLAQVPELDFSTTIIRPTNIVEQDLVLKLAEFPAVNRKVVESLNPSYLTTYLHELAQLFNTFYDQLPITQERNRIQPTKEEKQTRLALTAAIAQTLKNGLDLLNIAAPDRM